MKTFTTKNNTVFSLNVNFGTIKRVRALTGKDLMQLIISTEDGGKTLLEELSADVILLVDVLYAVCKPECDTKNITDEQFGEMLDCESVKIAFKALVEEIIDFFQEPQKSMAKKIIAKTWEIQDAADKRVMEMVNNGELDKILDKNLSDLSKSTDTSGSVPESAE